MINSKITVLDSLRAFAALSVCMFHFVCTVSGYITTKWILNVFSIGQFGVQLFFVISGFIIPWSMYHADYKIKNFFSFFLKRISRLEPPYIFSIILALLVLFIREKYFGKTNEHIQISSTQVFLHFGYLIPFFENFKWLNQVYWTLAIEFQYYLLIALIYIPIIKSGLPGRLLLYAVLIFSCQLSTEAFLPYWLPVFLVGILVFLVKTKIIGFAEYYLVTAAALTICFFTYPIAAVFYTVVPIPFILYWQNLKLIGLDFLGKFSYSIYLIHPIIGASLINLLSHYFNNPYSKVLVILSGTITTLVAAWVTYLLIEKPSKKLSSSISYKKHSV